jgi:predicted transposase/invertase (TIGR01784 family)
MPEVMVKPSSDIFVKYLLGREEGKPLLCSFINAVLHDSGFGTIVSIEIKNPFNLKEAIADKETILDIKAKDEKGRLYDVEVQTASDVHFRNRSLY